MSQRKQEADLSKEVDVQIPQAETEAKVSLHGKQNARLDQLKC